MSPQSSTKVVLFAFTLALGLTACASGGGGGSRPAGATTNRIVRAEIVALTSMNALQAIERLRPRWLQGRAGTAADPPVLYVDGARRGATSDLASMRADDIEQMEFMSASDATTRYGTGHGGGAVQVTTRR
jgi:hypothetical protein